MCGISGVVTNSLNRVENFLTCAERLQLHRGPDIQDRKTYSVGGWELGLGHQRLSILDLSNAGCQPMESSSGNSIISYNGEVYNYKELHEEHLKIPLKSGTDTEVILEVIESLGIETALKTFNGMWAFAWYNQLESKLYLARDRAGVKPLYYYNDGKNLFFSSEIKAVLSGPEKSFKLNSQVAGEYLCQSLQDSSEATFFEDVQALPAGSYAIIDLSKDKITLDIRRFWDVPATKSNLTFEEAQNQAYDIFQDSIRLRMRSDVPVGVTLSGGLDSSAIASMMKENLSEGQELKILSAVSPGSEHDESGFIDIMSDYLGVDVEKVVLGWEADEALELLRKVTWHNDSPLGSFSNVAHYLLMQKAKELGITVILSGQGADELLCGYKKYLGFYVQSLFYSCQFFRAFKVLKKFFLNGTVLNQFNWQEAKRYLPEYWKKNDVDIKGPALKNYQPVSLGIRSGQSVSERQTVDLKRFSVPYLTHYEDRMSMAWSREIRLPFLDYRLIELFISLPVSFKMSAGWTKYIFRKACEGFLPSRIVWRKDKQGFVNPQEEWLKKELKDGVLETFNENALIFQLGLIDREALLQNYSEFCLQGSGKGRVWYRDIFNPFALEIWLQQYKDFIINDVQSY
jgi:asparagine synthase (glutamine-hydrolysing)